jgi:hypothetical protein
MTTEHPGHSMAEIILANLRRAGWTVAVHNDFRLKGEPHTFWLLTHEATKRYAKGEGTSDLEALEICAHEAALVMDAPVQMGEPEIPGLSPLPVISLEDARRVHAEAKAWLGRPATSDIDTSPGGECVLLISELRQQLGNAIAVIETRFAAPDEFHDAEEAGDALRIGTAAFVGLEGYQTLLVDFHKRNHQGALGECPVPICAEGRQHLPRAVPLLKEVPVDPHLLFAAAVYDVHCRDVTSEQRAAAKKATYQLAYGGDVLKAADTLAVPADRVRKAIEIVAAQPCDQQ